jgi:hypothetical protein
MYFQQQRKQEICCVAGLIVKERRTRLSSENVDSVLFLHNNMQ